VRVCVCLCVCLCVCVCVCARTFGCCAYAYARQEQVVDRQDESKVYTSFDQVLPSRKDLERLSARQQATQGQEQQHSDAQEQEGNDGQEQGDLVVAAPVLLLLVLPSYRPLCHT